MSKLDPEEQRRLTAEKTRAATVSVGFNFASTIFKFLAAAVTGSVSLLSEAVHSATDIVASLIALISVRAAAAPPDEEHPFGHGKIESLTGFGEAVMLFVIVAYIVFQAIQRLVTPAAFERTRLEFGLYIIAAAAAVGFVVSQYVRGVGRRTNSMALISNGQHLSVDLVTTLGVFVGLLITRITGWSHADPVVALLMAAWIGFGAWRLVTNAFQELIDSRLPESEIARIRTTLDSEPRILSYHRLRTRRSGSVRNIDLHIVVPREWSVVQAHELADGMEKKLRQELMPAEVVIHVDPFDPDR